MKDRLLKTPVGNLLSWHLKEVKTT